MFKGVSFNARHYLEDGVYFNNSGKRDKPYRTDEPPAMQGLFVDEIVPFAGFTVWFYHGYPIAMYDNETKKYTLANCGWNTMTTKNRLNDLPDVRICQRNHVWYNRGKEFVDNAKEIYERIGRSLYQKIDGWRGYNQPIFAVAGASDTGSWSDSPARSEDSEDDIKMIARHLKAAGIKSYEAYGLTSNIFCIKRYLIVRGDDYQKAVEKLKGFDFHVNCRNAYRIGA